LSNEKALVTDNHLFYETDERFSAAVESFIRAGERLMGRLDSLAVRSSHLFWRSDDLFGGRMIRPPIFMT
jgi:hypothetical protein